MSHDRRLLCVFSEEQEAEVRPALEVLRPSWLALEWRQDGEAALAEVPTLRPDMVVVGMEIGSMEGLEFLALLMRAEPGSARPVMVAPGAGDPFPPVVHRRDPVTGRSVAVEMTRGDLPRQILEAAVEAVGPGSPESTAASPPVPPAVELAASPAAFAATALEVPAAPAASVATFEPPPAPVTEPARAPRPEPAPVPRQETKRTALADAASDRAAPAAAASDRAAPAAAAPSRVAPDRSSPPQPPAPMVVEPPRRAALVTAIVGTIAAAGLVVAYFVWRPTPEPVKPRPTSGSSPGSSLVVADRAAPPPAADKDEPRVKPDVGAAAAAAAVAIPAEQVLAISFGRASAQPEVADANSLAKLVAALAAAPKVQLEVGGHTSNEGSEEFNHRLGLSRAQAVVKLLVARGVAASRLQAKSYAGSAPLANNTSEDGRARNRRVTLRRLP